MSFNPYNKKSENTLEAKKVSSFETAKGSTYKYLPDGKIERFKKVTGEKFITDIVVFIPDWKWFTSNAPEDFLKEMGNQGKFEQTILSYVQNKDEKVKKVWIVDEKGNKIDKTEDLLDKSKVFLYFGNYEKADFIIPVSKIPQINYQTFDTKKYKDENGEFQRWSHIGNPVVKINYEQ